MNDRELLELAAKAAGSAVFELGGEWVQKIGKEIDGLERWVGRWNPLEDDGDALRLAVKLEMQICQGYRSIDTCIVGEDEGVHFSAKEPKIGDIYAATRRAITRAAAEIGKTQGASDAGNGD